MIRRLFRLVVLAGIAAGIVAAVRALTASKDPLPAPPAPSADPWPPLAPEPRAATPSAPKPTDDVAPAPDAPVTKTVPEPDGVPVADTGATPWVEPDADGECPSGFPIKAKLKSKIFHSPGQLNYDRTTPDRCYVDGAAAEADGLRAAKR